MSMSMTVKNVKFATLTLKSVGFPWWHSGLESACQCKGHRFDLWSRRIPQAVEQLGPWPQLLSPRPRARAPSTTREATTVRSLSTGWKSSPRAPQLEKARRQHRRPSTAKNEYTFKKCALHCVWMFYINWKITEAGEVFLVPVLMRVLQRHRTNDGSDILADWTNDWLIY